MAEETTDASDFMESLKGELVAEEVFVFTPKGDVVSLPSGATPIDFAYHVHTEVGHRTIGARVNDRIVPLDSELVSGDRVEVITGKNSGPSRDWLAVVQSGRAQEQDQAVLQQGRPRRQPEPGTREDPGPPEEAADREGPLGHPGGRGPRDQLLLA